MTIDLVGFRWGIDRFRYVSGMIACRARSEKLDITVSKPDYDRVMQIVRKILRENSINAPPVSPREIAEAYGIEVIEVTFNDRARDVAGFFDFEEKKICVNAQEPYNRKTFTIAHELGHHFLHRDRFDKKPSEYGVLLRRPMKAANSSLEKEANAFAAHLLVPKKFLDRYVEFASVERLAEIFAVSKDVIRARLEYEYGADA